MRPSPTDTSISPPAHRSRRSWWRIAWAFVRLPHPGPIVLVLAATAGFAVLAHRDLPPVGQLTRLLLAMLGGQLAIGAVNEVVDAELDAGRPAKPIPAGEVSARAALVMATMGLTAMIGFSASFGFASLALCALGTGAGLAYDLWLKRTYFSWLPYLIALPLVPIWVWTALDQYDRRLLLLYPLGALLVVAVHLSQSAPDIAGDRAAGLRTLATVLGEPRALWLCWAATVSAPALILAVGAPSVAHQRLLWLAAGTVALCVALNIGVYRRNRQLGLRLTFPCVALSAAVLGLGWVYGLTDR